MQPFADSDSRMLDISNVNQDMSDSERIRTMNLAISLKVLSFIQGVECFILLWLWYNMNIIDPGLQFNVFGSVYLGLIVANVLFALVGFFGSTLYDLTLIISYTIFLAIKLLLNCWLIFFTTYFSLTQLYWIFSMIQALVGGLYILIAVLFGLAISKHGPPDFEFPQGRKEAAYGYDSNDGILM